MTRIKQDIPAGRIQPSRFDTVLPPDVRQELGSRIPGRPKPARQGDVPPKEAFGWLPLAAALFACFAAGFALRPQTDGRTPIKATTAFPAPSQALEPAPGQASLQPAPASSPQTVAQPLIAPQAPALALGPAREQNRIESPPAPEPMPTPDFSWHSTYVDLAPRAALVKLPPPRAQLVAIPLRIGATYTLHMPYNLEVLATFKGFLPAENYLPLQGNEVGDMFVVGPNKIPWLWILAPGADHLDWIDP
jgi:hypothetical protein